MASSSLRVWLLLGFVLVPGLGFHFRKGPSPLSSHGLTPVRCWSLPGLGADKSLRLSRMSDACHWHGELRGKEQALPPLEWLPGLWAEPPVFPREASTHTQVCAGVG